MKFKATLLFLCSIFAVGASWAAAPKTLHYEIKLKSASFGNMGTRKMWLKGDNMRWEGKSARLPLLLVKNKDGAFLVHPWYKYAAKYPKDSNRANPKVLFAGPTGPVKDFLKEVKAKKHGTETINNDKCTIYAYTDPITKHTSMIWVSNKSGKPAKITLKGEKSKVDTITATYTKFEVGTKVADSLFELPKGYKVKPMPSRKLTSKPGEAKSTAKKSG